MWLIFKIICALMAFSAWKLFFTDDEDPGWTFAIACIFTYLTFGA